jgi:hypothetical protein
VIPCGLLETPQWALSPLWFHLANLVKIHIAERHGLLDDLWNATSPEARAFDPAQISGLPQEVRLYLEHAIRAGTPLAFAVRLRMHGEIKLGSWRPFSAEEIIRWNRGMIWRATVRVHGMSIRGADSFVDGRGFMRWKLFGVVPVVNASGPDITRSAAGRINLESIWLPSVLCCKDVSWKAVDKCHLHAEFVAHNQEAAIDYIIDNAGWLKAVSMPRWGNPEGAGFHYVRCGGFVEEEREFGGYTIPSRLRVGWHFGTERFDSEGEFFRVTVDSASFR